MQFFTLYTNEMSRFWIMVCSLLRIIASNVFFAFVRKVVDMFGWRRPTIINLVVLWTFIMLSRGMWRQWSWCQKLNNRNAIKGLKSRDSEDIALNWVLSGDPFFVCFQIRLTTIKNTGGGYRNAFWRFGTIGLLENAAAERASIQDCLRGYINYCKLH